MQPLFDPRQYMFLELMVIGDDDKAREVMAEDLLALPKIPPYLGDEVIAIGGDDDPLTV